MLCSRRSHRSLRGGFPMVTSPGTSCQATIDLSLRDGEYQLTSVIKLTLMLIRLVRRNSNKPQYFTTPLLQPSTTPSPQGRGRRTEIPETRNCSRENSNALYQLYPKRGRSYFWLRQGERRRSLSAATRDD